VLRLGDAVEGQQVPGPSQGTDRGCVGLGRRFEPREGALEQQLVAHRFGGAEVKEPPDARVEKLARGLFVVGLVHPFSELGGRLAEHGVVDGVLRVKVGIHGRRGDARAAGQVSQRQTDETLPSHQFPGGVEDRVTCRAPACFPPVRRLGQLYHRSLSLHSVKSHVKCETEMEVEVDTTDDAVMLRPAVVLRREDAWAYTPEHRELLGRAHDDSREGRVRRLNADELKELGG